MSRKQIEARLQLVKGRLNRLVNLANEVEKDRSRLDLFKAHYRDIKILKSDFEDSQLQLSSDTSVVSEESSSDAAFEEFDLAYYRIQEVYSRVVTSSSVSGSERGKGESRPTSTSVKLPKLQLPTFTGNVTAWTSFFHLCCALVHTNDTLSAVEKHQYLLTSLEGEPLNLIKTLPLSQDNYDLAWKTLIDKYQDVRKIATIHVDKILHFPTVPADSPSALQQLVDAIKENLGALRVLKFPFDEWSFLLLNIILPKLDVQTRRLFEIAHKDAKVPGFNQLLDFLDSHCKALVTADLLASSSISTPRQLSRSAPSGRAFQNIKRTFLATPHVQGCVVCNNDHVVSRCPVFLALPPPERRDAVRVHRLCFNCLKPHRVRDCTSNQTCRSCRRPYHSLLHDEGSAAIRRGDEKPPSKPAQGNESSKERLVDKSSEQEGNSHPIQSNDPATLVSFTSATNPSYAVILGTAIAHIPDVCGNLQQVRVLLDSGSQSSFISEECVQRLGLKCRRVHVSVSGLAQSAVEASKGSVVCTLQSCYGGTPQLVVDALILSHITSSLPSVSLPHQVHEQYVALQLADPSFHTPGPIDMLIGAEAYPDVFDGGRHPVEPGYPAAFHTMFGWVLMGRLMHQTIQTGEITSLFGSTVHRGLSEVVRQFWETEELPTVKHMSPEDDECEKHFLQTHFRDAEGRYTVRLPFREPQLELGESRIQAVKRLQQLERRLSRQPDLRVQYSQFLEEYKDLGHMHELTDSDEQARYYIPHHCIIKDSSSTTKLRVVFDASAATSNGNSLNDTLLKGPKLQKDISEIITRFRLHPFVLTADISKMYRQVRLHQDDRPYQVILWRKSEKERVREFQLDTVTYGVSAAPFLAMRALRQLAADEQSSHPEAARVIREDVFVDDIVTGAASLPAAVSLKGDLINLLKRGGFELKKWSSNHPSLLEAVPADHKERLLKFQDGKEVLKILGVIWDPNSDRFSYHFRPVKCTSTKRAILSTIAQIFDPLGWIAPVVFLAKLLLQNLWLLGLNWDETPPPDIQKKWISFLVQLPSLGEVNISRFISGEGHCAYQLHGFSDASVQGYAAVVYLRTNCEGVVHVHLLFAKTKVAPLKTVTLPRLELLGAHLLAKALRVVDSALCHRLAIERVTAWSDSTVVLSWIRTPPHRLKTFVANRVAYIQDGKSPIEWRHVSSEENPADCASRGLMPRDLLDHPLWWHGPKWLKLEESAWPSGIVAAHVPEVHSELRVPDIVVLTAQQGQLITYLLLRHSSWSTLQRVLAYVIRFGSNARKRRLDRQGGPLTTSELEVAQKICVKRVQHDSFKQDCENLKAGRAVSAQLKGLNPILDSGSILRVGGRIQNSQLSDSKKHPMLLPKSSHLTNLIIDHYHILSLHGGLSTTLSLVRTQYWILAAKGIIKTRIFRCVKCFRFKVSHTQPIMGNLPAFRVQQSRPFLSVGVDYGGPFQVKHSHLRTARVLKAYLCLFVCLATKAVHLEVVSSLSTDAFLNAFHRFVSRRGLCQHVYSDCGTNFVGAHHRLVELERFLRDPANASHVATQLSSKGIQWHFNPPSAPHFGGLWEAGMKSAKHHLRRVIGQQILTFEELTTVFAQIEAVLNSRPLCSLSSDPNDLEALTPAHFLIGENLLTPPSADVTNISTNRLDRYQLLHSAAQHFWKRWSREYLHTLQQRGKWMVNDAPLSVGDLVLVKEDNLPPLQWLRGRVETLLPGKDGVARVAVVKTCKGSITRAVVKLCCLPSQ